MRDISVIGMDIAKHVFQVHGVDRVGNKVLTKKLKRGEVSEFFRHLKPSVVAMESCGSAHYWGRELEKLGFEVKLIAPQFVKPYVKSNKNDRADAEAICEAAQRPSMRFCKVKSVAQQELQHLHRVRERLMKNQTACSNALRGTLYEYGFIIAKGKKAIQRVAEILENDTSCQISSLGKALINEMVEEYRELEKRTSKLNTQLEQIAKEHPVCNRLMTIPGVGPTIATAIVATAPAAEEFVNGRNFAAWLGLVPKQFGTGGVTKLLGISKRGDVYLRKLLVHGARSVLMVAGKRKDALSQWVMKLKLSKCWNKASVALANKNARIIWALLSSDTAVFSARLACKE